MNVLQIIPALAHRYGGPAAVIRDICNSLDSAGVSVELAATTANGAGQELDDAQQDDVRSEFSHPVHLFPRRRSEQWKYSPQLSAWLNANVHRFDVVHIHALWSHASQSASRAASKRRVPTVVRPAGMLSDYSFEHGVWKKRIYWNLLEKRTVARAKAVHVTSSTEWRDVLKRCPGSQVHVIANGVSDEAWSLPRPGDTRASQPRILFVGRMHPVKGLIDLLLPAFERMSMRASLKIAGGVDSHAPDYAESVQQAVSASPRKTDIELLGEIPPADRWQLFDQADLFVLPSHSENFGIVVAEAFARKCAVVVTDRVQSCEHVLAANGGAVVPLDVDRLAKAMDDMLSDPVARNNMALRGYDYAKNNFAWPAIAQQIITMYEGCMSR